jgi:hypothetical protein
MAALSFRPEIFAMGWSLPLGRAIRTRSIDDVADDLRAPAP